ncbi:hypothetical protein BCV70DRAFT_202993 [Testicularia cyperi]|uniref:Hydrophobin n=1 Tax=Testicularia cyperi TaxID=1882483 RepID=A0A317XFV7_9BASI|nr:hypothetical protein BCV70DRAFT_202993 [Testicularia cyperi]
MMISGRFMCLAVCLNVAATLPAAVDALPAAPWKGNPQSGGPCKIITISSPGSPGAQYSDEAVAGLVCCASNAHASNGVLKTPDDYNVKTGNEHCVSAPRISSKVARGNRAKRDADEGSGSQGGKGFPSFPPVTPPRPDHGGKCPPGQDCTHPLPKHAPGMV